MIKRLVFIFCVLLLNSPVFAAPPLIKSRPEPPEQPGTSLQQRAVKGAPGVLLAPALYPASVNILFLRVQFQETADPRASRVTGSGLWLDPLYSQPFVTPVNADDLADSSNFWVTNAKTNFINYWQEASYGLLKIIVDISPKVYQLPHNTAYYGNESYAALENLIYDSITSSLTDTDPATRPTFSSYDAVLIIHAGVGEESDVYGDTPNDVWSLYYKNSSIASNASPDATCSNCLSVTLKDGKPIHEAIIMPQSDCQDGNIVDPLGVYVHEFGHWLGLPDLYCTGWSCASSGPDGVGKWSLMGDGIYNIDPGHPTWYGSSPAHPDAWSKVFLGWVVPQAPASHAEMSRRILNPVETNAEVIKIQASSGTGSQYFLLENKQKTGFDKGLPGHGLLVWLIDDSVIGSPNVPGSNISRNTINNSKIRPGVKVIEADNDWKLLTYGCGGNNDDCGSAGDTFPGLTNNTSLTPHTAPASSPYTSYAWVNIKNIAEAGPSPTAVSIDLGFAPLPPSPGMYLNTVVWTASQDPGVTAYTVYRNGAAIAQTTATSYTDGSAASGDVYRVTAMDAQGNESDFSREVVIGGGSSNCFIATATYGSPLDPHVVELRKFRDHILMTNAAGRTFVSLYYRYSPPLADFISRHDTLRILMRWLLTPVVYAVEYPVVFMMAVGGMGLSIVFRRRMKAKKA